MGGRKLVRMTDRKILKEQECLMKKMAGALKNQFNSLLLLPKLARAWIAMKLARFRDVYDNSGQRRGSRDEPNCLSAYAHIAIRNTLSRAHESCSSKEHVHCNICCVSNALFGARDVANQKLCKIDLREGCLFFSCKECRKEPSARFLYNVLEISSTCIHLETEIALRIKRTFANVPLSFDIFYFSYKNHGVFLWKGTVFSVRAYLWNDVFIDE